MSLSPLLEHLYAALNEPVGVLVTTDNGRLALSQAKYEQQKNLAFGSLIIFLNEADMNQLVILRGRNDA